MAKRYDRDAIYKVYRTGQYTDREIAAQFGCSHTLIYKYRKQYGWIKDLSSRVRQSIASKLVANIANGNDDDEVVDAAAEIGAKIIISHRIDIKNLQTLETALISELGNSPKKLYIAQYQGNLVEKELELTASERAQATNNLANVQHKRIQLERQAYNLDDPDRDKDVRGVKVNLNLGGADA